MRSRFSFAIVLLLTGFAWWYLIHRIRLVFADESLNGLQAGACLFDVLLLSLATGIVVVKVILPAIGELVGNFFFAPNVELQRSYQDKARAAMERGDLDKALGFFYDALKEEPGDVFVTSEIARLLCTYREAPEVAREFLEEALRRDWTRDDLAFLLLRLADICAYHASDPARGRELWQGVILAYPGTHYAEQAQTQIATLDWEERADGPVANGPVD